MTSRPNSINTSQMICLACPLVGATYKTALPVGQRNPSISKVTAESLDFPHRRPAAMTLNLVLSANTSCCHGKSEKLRSDIFGLYVFCLYGVVPNVDATNA